jgi:hypothetical protein
METLWIISGAVVVSVIASILRIRRSTAPNLGSVSRDWVIRHEGD